MVQIASFILYLDVPSTDNQYKDFEEQVAEKYDFGEARKAGNQVFYENIDYEDVVGEDCEEIGEI